MPLSPVPPARLSTDAFGRLVLSVAGGDTFTAVVPVRAFPLSDPGRWISFLDARGHEVWSLDDPALLLPDDRARLEAELSRREFLPEIKAIRSISPGAEPTTWDVETDRGPSRFALPSEDHVRRLPDDGALVTDDHGVRYRIRSVEALDATSRTLLRRYL